METAPEFITYCVLDQKGRITIPQKLREGKKGFLLAQTEHGHILIDPKDVKVRGIEENEI